MPARAGVASRNKISLADARREEVDRSAHVEIYIRPAAHEDRGAHLLPIQESLMLLAIEDSIAAGSTSAFAI